MKASAPRLSVLVLADDDRTHANTILQHIGALVTLSRHDVRVYNTRGLDRSRSLDLDEFDVVVLHYTLITIVDHYLAPAFREKIRQFGGLKIQIIQDDYRWVNDFRAMIRELGITVLFTLVPEREIESVWPEAELPGVERITTLAGYVALDAGCQPVPSLADRKLDIVYRGRTLPFWVGRLGQEKAWIAQGVLDRAAAYGLRCDVDWREGARIYGEDWLRFMSSGRATLGTESGSTITDFDGSIERRTLEYLKRHPGADYFEVHREVLAPFEGNVMMNVVSPRVFEAITLRTALVLFPGEYSGVVEPERHYIALAKDFANFDEVAARLRDVRGLTEMTERAYEEIIASERYSIRRFVERFDLAIDEHGAPRRASTTRWRYTAALAERHVAVRAAPFWMKVGGGGRRAHAQVLGYGARYARFSPGIIDAPLKALLSLLLTLRTPALRRLLHRYVRHAVRRHALAVPPREVLEDLLKLALVQRLRTGCLECRPHARIAVTTERAGDDLVLRSVPMPARVAGPVVGSANVSTASDSGDDGRMAWLAGVAPDRVMWDHSAVGSTVRWPLPIGRSIYVAVGEEPGGQVHEFKSIPALAALFPEEVEQAVS